MDAVIWFLQGIWSGFAGLVYVLTHLGTVLDFSNKENVMRVIYYGASTELFFVFFNTFVLVFVIGLVSRGFLWRVTIGLEGFANVVGRIAAWAGLALFAVLGFGEEARWGQHIFHWTSTGAFASENLQAETNLHNFISPRLYDIAYAAVGWGMVGAAGLLSLRPQWLAPLLRHPPLDRASVVRIALLVSAGVLLQHELFEEMAEAVAILAVVFLLAELALTGRAPARAAHPPVPAVPV